MTNKVGWTCGAFDLLHSGHIELLKDCKTKCDYLIVGLQSDPSIDRSEKNKPIQSIEERLIMLKAIKYVDKVVIYHTEADLLALLKLIKPDIRINGIDWKGKPFTGHELDMEYHYHSRNHNWSSSDLRRRVYKAEQRNF